MTFTAGTSGPVEVLGVICSWRRLELCYSAAGARLSAGSRARSTGFVS
jgi:hypothetical protein